MNKQEFTKILLQNTQNSLQTLIAARELISDPNKFTSDVEARNVDGEVCTPRNRKAAKWNGLGAIMKFRKTNLEGLFCDADFSDPIEITSEYGGHQAVLDAFDNGITTCKASIERFTKPC